MTYLKNVYIHYKRELIYLNKITREVEKQPNELISRLTWKTHLVKYPYFVRTTKIREDTSKPFAGKIIENENRFRIKRIRPYFHYVLPVFIVSGDLTNRGQKTILTLKFHLGFISTLFLIYILIPFFYIIQNSIKNGFQVNSLTWLLLPFLFGIMGAYEIQNIKEKLFEILDIE